MAAFVGIMLCALTASAQYSTAPAKPSEIEDAYTVAIEKRTTDILTELALNDPTKSAKLHDVITNQYRTLRARDAAIDAKLKEAGAAETDRATLLKAQSKSLHDQFIASLSAELTPAQVEMVKDKMTYNKVKVTYDAYCAIVPGLTDKEKARILEMLKAAREEAIDGGSAQEKSDIFQRHKEQINEYLTAQGHDVAKAYRDWNAKQELAKKQKEAADAKITQ